MLSRLLSAELGLGWGNLPTVRTLLFVEHVLAGTALFSGLMNEELLNLQWNRRPRFAVLK